MQQQLLRILVLMLCIIGTVLGQSYEQCGTNNIGTLESVTVENCQPETVCVLKRGTNTTIHVTFTTKSDVAIVKNNVTGTIANIQLPFPNFDTDGCNPQFGLKCPLIAGNTNNYVATIGILKLYPTLSTKVTWEITDEKRNIIVCFKVDAKIVD